MKEKIKNNLFNVHCSVTVTVLVPDQYKPLKMKKNDCLVKSRLLKGNINASIWIHSIWERKKHKFIWMSWSIGIPIVLSLVWRIRCSTKYSSQKSKWKFNPRTRCRHFDLKKSIFANATSFTLRKQNQIVFVIDYIVELVYFDKKISIDIFDFVLDLKWAEKREEAIYLLSLS